MKYDTVFSKVHVFTASMTALSLSALAFTTPVYAASATLTLTPATISTAAGQTFTVSINLDTGGNATDGTRAIVQFDPTLLESTKITPGTIYKEYPTTAQQVDNTAGTLKLSGIADTTATYTGSGTFATLEFKAKAAGTGTIKFDFRGAGVTEDSNVADNATSSDILGAATGATVTIRASGTTATTAPIASGGTTASMSPQLPNTASVSQTIAMLSFGGAFILLSTLFFATAKNRTT